MRMNVRVSLVIVIIGMTSTVAQQQQQQQQQSEELAYWWLGLPSPFGGKNYNLEEVNFLFKCFICYTCVFKIDKKWVPF